MPPNGEKDWLLQIVMPNGIGNTSLNLTLVIHNFIISYDEAHYHNIRINVAIY